MLGTTGYIKSLCIAGYPDKYNESDFVPGNESLEPTYSILPNAYKVLDYIELTGTQYINTEVYMSNKNRIEIDLQYTITEKSGSYSTVADLYSINGVQYATATSGNIVPEMRNDLGIFVVSNEYYWFWGLNGQHHSTYERIKPDKNRHTLMIDCGTGEYGIDTTIYKTSINTKDFADKKVNFFLGARNSYNPNKTPKSTIASYCNEKVFGCKIFISNKLERNFIPALRKADSTAGLYDLVNNKFYTNAGTGSFKYNKGEQ